MHGSYILSLFYLFRSVRPLLSQTQYEATRAEVAKFQQYEGPKLQALLEARARNCANWVSKDGLG